MGHNPQGGRDIRESVRRAQVIEQMNTCGEETNLLRIPSNGCRYSAPTEVEQDPPLTKRGWHIVTFLPKNREREKE